MAAPSLALRSCFSHLVQVQVFTPPSPASGKPPTDLSEKTGTLYLCGFRFHCLRPNQPHVKLPLRTGHLNHFLEFFDFVCEGQKKYLTAT